MRDITGTYWQKGPKRRRFFRKWFHNSRLIDFSKLVESGEIMLSVGAGTGDFEKEILENKFSQCHILEIDKEKTIEVKNKGLDPVVATGTLLPFQNDSFDAVVAVGFVEHINPFERLFFKESYRCLKPGGHLYLTIPIEVGFGGLLRYIGKNFTYGNRNYTPDGIQRYLDFTWEELRGETSKDSPEAHRYYNYKYTIHELDSVFDKTSIQGWPIKRLKTINLILFGKACKSEPVGIG